MTASTDHVNDPDWLLGPIPELPGVRHTVLVTSDGLVKAHCSATNRELAERTAASVSGLQSLAKALAREYSSPAVPEDGALVDARPGHQVISITDGCIFLRPVKGSAVLAVVTGPEVDPGLIAQFMQEQVQKVGAAMTSRARTPVPEHG
ncbi:roadblock/LC7 domain-containing protein [Streptomyces sp. NPDC058195]|uniref:roadblock/LC7 domain-containing protein n=1 Tax=Streptomyces sp. NPDC058195 TaxID=3346375 RepID=UPI0036E7C888